MNTPDPDLCLACFGTEERAVVEAWVEELGQDPDAWSAWAPLFAVVEMLAVHRMAADVEAPNAGDRIRWAAEALGLEDDPDRATHPGDRYLKRMERWEKAIRAARQIVQPSPTGVV